VSSFRSPIHFLVFAFAYFLPGKGSVYFYWFALADEVVNVGLVWLFKKWRPVEEARNAQDELLLQLAYLRKLTNWFVKVPGVGHLPASAVLYDLPPSASSEFTRRHQHAKDTFTQDVPSVCSFLNKLGEDAREIEGAVGPAPRSPYRRFVERVKNYSKTGTGLLN